MNKLRKTILIDSKMNSQKCIYERNQTSDISFHIPLCNAQDEHPVVCYSFWKLVESTEQSTSREFILHAKGCWGKDRNLCKTKLFNNGLLFCCCEGEFCNRNLNAENCLAQLNQHFDTNGIGFFELSAISNDAINLVCLVILFTVIPIIVFCLIRLLVNRARRPTPEDHNKMKLDLDMEKLLINHDHIEIIEHKARGRYGDIYKARLIETKDQITISSTIAIKVFQQVDYESFRNEFKIYRLTNFSHENILTFIKAELRTGNLLNTPEYWLITEYQENGSLQDYLANNLLDEKQIHLICLDIANGLTFLHGSSNRQIAHRDFKSSNVLLNAKLRACLADFGSSFVFYNHNFQSDSLNQVGTYRYFSPELLDGAINFSGDSLLKVDIYACALVFWEILSRCKKLQNQNQIKEYKLPFELELGTMPSIDELRNHISFKQRRPVIEAHWRSNEFLNEFCRLLDDCWDNDAESRITSACVLERLKSFKQNF